MPPDRTKPPDWSEPSHYDDLRQLDRSGFAWELLRRNPAYRQAVGLLHPHTDPDGTVLLQSPSSSAAAADWGLSFPRGSWSAGPFRPAVLAL